MRQSEVLVSPRIDDVAMRFAWAVVSHRTGPDRGGVGLHIQRAQEGARKTHGGSSADVPALAHVAPRMRVRLFAVPPTVIGLGVIRQRCALRIGGWCPEVPL